MHERKHCVSSVKSTPLLCIQLCCMHSTNANCFSALFRGPPVFGDHPGEPVPEENFWTLWCKGRLTEAETPTVLLGATPSGLTSAHLHLPPIFLQAGCPSCRLTNSVKALKATNTNINNNKKFTLSEYCTGLFLLNCIQSIALSLRLLHRLASASFLLTVVA